MAKWRISTVLRGQWTVVCTLLAVAALVALAGAQRPPEAPRPPAPDPGRSPDVLTQHGLFPAEEWFVRDLYARLVRYEVAGREFRAVATGERPHPTDGLEIRIADMESGGAEPARIRHADRILRLNREVLCHEEDPCHVLYQPSWGTADGPAVASGEAATRYTQYRVMLRYQGQQRSYRAYVAFSHRPDGTTHVQVFDPYVPELDQFAGERSPFARAPWRSYVKTRRYVAVIREVSQWRSELARWPKQPRIGYVLGDRVTPEDEMMVLMSFSSCGGQSLSLSADSTELRPAGTGGTSSTTVRVQGTPGTAVSLLASGTPNSGGHIDAEHIGSRHVGTFSPQANGVIGSDGLFLATYNASHIAGPVTIAAQGGGASATALVQVRVQGLQELGIGTGYTLTGFSCCPAHPEGTNHWGTPAANAALTNIPLHYRARYPGAENLRYNDQSLPLGGKFDLARNWENTGPDGHNEHRVGINTDVTKSPGTAGHHVVLQRIFEHCGSPNTLSHSSHWHLRQEGAACNAPIPNNASFRSHSVPPSMNAGQSYAVSVTMRNTGSATWTAGEGYKLGSQNPENNQTWGLSRVAVPADVPPFDDVTFSFTVTAPFTPGTYNFQWLMVREWVQWFGDLTPNVAVTVGGGGGPGPSGMHADSAVRGCADWWWWNPVYQPSANACHDYCTQNNADACEWFVNGDCYVEFGSGCYVQPGFPGWSAAVLNSNPALAQLLVRPMPPEPALKRFARRLGLGRLLP